RRQQRADHHADRPACRNGAALRHLPSGNRTVNTIWMWAALLAIDLSAWLQELAGLDHGNGRGRAHLATLRHRLLTVLARLVRHAGQVTLRLPPGQHLLAHVLTRLRHLPAWT
ncbi:MAG TPA: transposase, partial [Acidimicrobiales bacterium]|nr:transposase [Acidimicrobiales bacterium]